MNCQKFISQFGNLFEHSPWVAEDAYDVWCSQYGSQYSVNAIHSSMVEAFQNTARPKRLDVLKAHPDLAGKLAQAKRLTAESTAEQASAGLDALTDHERETFTQLNVQYTDKFSFPFIIAVRDHDKQSILNAFERRINNDVETEFSEACRQVERIVYHRLKDMVHDH